MANSSQAKDSMLDLLNIEATNRARQAIAARFTDPGSIDDISSLRSQLQKQLATAESQLNHAVQSKLDALKRAVDIMADSSERLENVSSILSSVDNRIMQTNTSMSKFEYLKKVHYAKENLQKVVSQVEFFAKVPEKVEELNETLDNDPIQLKEVYLESIKLEVINYFICLSLFFLFFDTILLILSF